MTILFFCVAFLACTIGKICGMGGGVIIKPVLDASGILEVSAINYLSGCTVLGMSLWSVGKSMVRRESDIDLGVSTPLGIGAAAGGLLGKRLYSEVSYMFSNPDTAGGVQAILLLAATAATLFYTIRKDQIRSHRTKSRIACILIGLGLGMFGSFLGIGGGPFNMAVLYYFFSMSTKTAAQNSLCIILISQLFALAGTFVSGSTFQVSTFLLAGMILCGIAGSEAGARINRKLNESRATLLFESAMVLVMCICVYNIHRFL